MNTIVYYDGLCHLCSREIDHYSKMKGAERLEFRDISSPEFDASKENLDPQAIQKVMHVRAANGELRTGVDAFKEIWSQLDRLRWLVPLAARTPLKQLLSVGYSGFARVRPWLPRRKCASDHCAI